MQFGKISVTGNAAIEPTRASGRIDLNMTAVNLRLYLYAEIDLWLWSDIWELTLFSFHTRAVRLGGIRF